MNKAALKRMTRRTEFYMFIVLILLCVLVQIKSGGVTVQSTPNNVPTALPRKAATMASKEETP